MDNTFDYHTLFKIPAEKLLSLFFIVHLSFVGLRCQFMIMPFMIMPVLDFILINDLSSFGVIVLIHKFFRSNNALHALKMLMKIIVVTAE